MAMDSRLPLAFRAPIVCDRITVRGLRTPSFARTIFLVAAICVATLVALTARAQTSARSTGAVLLSPGDLIRVTMQEDPEVRYEGEISAAGTIPVPYLGEFAVVGMTQEAAGEALGQDLCKELYQKATVSVTLVRKSPGKVYVYGAVKRAGVVPMPEVGSLTMLQLISEVDGLTTWADPDGAFLLRKTKPGASPERIEMKLTQLFSQAAPGQSSDIVLAADDIICVPGMSGSLYQFISADESEVLVVGEVKEPGIVTFAPGEERTLIRAVFKAGGFSDFAKTKTVRLIRQNRGEPKTEVLVDASAVIEKGELGQDVPLEAGDMIIVPQKLLNF